MYCLNFDAINEIHWEKLFYPVKYKQFWPFSYVYTINQVIYIQLSPIKNTDIWKVWFIK